MNFEFDPFKAKRNLQKHGVSFADAEAVFHDTLAIHQEDPYSTGENRFIAIGMDNIEQLLVVVYTVRNETIRLISARRATRKEAKYYETGI